MSVSTANFGELLEPGLRRFYQDSYNDFPEMFSRVFEVLNSGKASAADIKRLADILKEKVKSEFGYILEEEITFLGDY